MADGVVTPAFLDAVAAACRTLRLLADAPIARPIGATRPPTCRPGCPAPWPCRRRPPRSPSSSGSAARIRRPDRAARRRLRAQRRRERASRARSRSRSPRWTGSSRSTATNLSSSTQPGVINARLKAAVAERRPVLRARSGELRDVLDRRQPGHERRRAVLRQVRPDARFRALARGRDGRRHGHPDRRQEHQGRGRLLADPPDRRVAGDPRAHHRGDPPAAPDARRRGRRCWRSSRRSSRRGRRGRRRSPPRACRR